MLYSVLDTSLAYLHPSWSFFFVTFNPFSFILPFTFHSLPNPISILSFTHCNSCSLSFSFNLQLSSKFPLACTFSRLYFYFHLQPGSFFIISTSTFVLDLVLLSFPFHIYGATFTRLHIFVISFVTFTPFLHKFLNNAFSLIKNICTRIFSFIFQFRYIAVNIFQFSLLIITSSFFPFHLAIFLRYLNAVDSISIKTFAFTLLCHHSSNLLVSSCTHNAIYTRILYIVGVMYKFPYNFGVLYFIQADRPVIQDFLVHVLIALKST